MRRELYKNTHKENDKTTHNTPHHTTTHYTILDILEAPQRVFPHQHGPPHSSPLSYTTHFPRHCAVLDRACSFTACRPCVCVRLYVPSLSHFPVIMTPVTLALPLNRSLKLLCVMCYALSVLLVTRLREAERKDKVRMEQIIESINSV